MNFKTPEMHSWQWLREQHCTTRFLTGCSVTEKSLVAPTSGNIYWMYQRWYLEHSHISDT